MGQFVFAHAQCDTPWASSRGRGQRSSVAVLLAARLRDCDAVWTILFTLYSASLSSLRLREEQQINSSHDRPPYLCSTPPAYRTAHEQKQIDRDSALAGGVR